MYYLLALLSDVGITACFSINKVFRGLTPYKIHSIAFKIAVSCAVSFLLFFAVNGFGIQVNGFTLCMALLMSVAGALSEIVTFTAYGKGQISLYSVFQMQGGMLLPFLYGAMNGNEVTPFHITGILVMVASLVMTVLPQKGRGEKPKGGFVLLCCLIFFINGAISVISYIYSNSPLGTGPESFIMLKALILLLFWAPLAVFKRGKAGSSKGDKRQPLRLFALIALASLIESGSYFAQLVSAAHLPAVVMYPLVTGGTVVLMAVAGAVFFKERHRPCAIAGFALTLLATLMFAL